MPNNILIISHTFPPSPGIGGRRWAKFAKYLNKLGHNIFVLTAENIQQGSSEWTDDVKGLAVEYLPYNFPKILTLPVKTVFDKINYRLSLAKLKLADKGNYYDKCIFWQRQIEEKISFYVNNKSIDTIIVTGAPFRLVYYVTNLKSKFKGVTFIADFRDQWAEDTEVSSFSQLSPLRQNIERGYEKSALLSSDFVFTVSEKMKQYFASQTTKNNCIVIPNGYDVDDIDKNKILPPLKEEEKLKINFVFAGTLYNNLDYILTPFFAAVKKLKDENAKLYSLLNVEFYGKFPLEYQKYVTDNKISDVITINGEKPYSVVFNKIQGAHYGLLFLNDQYNYSFSTKFCEYVAQKKKIIVVSNKGDTSEFVIKNNLGFYISPDSSFKDLVSILEHTVKKNLEVELNNHFDETTFAIDKISRQIEKYLNKI